VHWAETPPADFPGDVRGETEDISTMKIPNDVFMFRPPFNAQSVLSMRDFGNVPVAFPTAHLCQLPHRKSEWTARVYPGM
jgi:hypothetical protein